MITVHRYMARIIDDVMIDMPAGAHPLSVAQRSETCTPDKFELWARVDTERPLRPHRFRVVGTGHEIPSEDQYGYFVGTFFVDGGRLVFHVFQMRTSDPLEH